MTRLLETSIERARRIIAETDAGRAQLLDLDAARNRGYDKRAHTSTDVAHTAGGHVHPTWTIKASLFAARLEASDAQPDARKPERDAAASSNRGHRSTRCASTTSLFAAVGLKRPRQSGLDGRAQ